MKRFQKKRKYHLHKIFNILKGITGRKRNFFSFYFYFYPKNLKKVFEIVIKFDLVVISSQFSCVLMKNSFFYENSFYFKEKLAFLESSDEKHEMSLWKTRVHYVKTFRGAYN